MNSVRSRSNPLPAASVGRAPVVSVTPVDDVERAKALLVWARDEGMPLARVVVGGVEVELVPMAPGAPGASATTPSSRITDMSDADARESIYRRFGGQVMDAALGNSPSTDVDDDEPAIGSAAG